MAIDAHTDVLQKILQDLNSHIDGLEQILIIQQNGTLLARLFPEEHSEKIEAILAEFAMVADEVCQELKRGGNTEAILKGRHRFLAVYRTRSMKTMLGIVGQASVNLGLLNSGSRSAIEKIEAIVTD